MNNLIIKLKKKKKKKTFVDNYLYFYFYFLYYIMHVDIQRLLASDENLLF